MVTITQQSPLTLYNAVVFLSTILRWITRSTLPKM